MKNREQFKALEKFGPIGVSALKNATPKESSVTANSWYYETVNRSGYFAIHWYNSHIEEPGRIPIAAIIQYGHATRQGGYVQGRDYINPAMQPIFDQIVADMWREVTK
ncbi:MAG: HK97 gp10 family phage protein [Ktedonobacteraceae bacterium]|jgi:hypothetical protein